tara:strand:+ start:1839 stop:2084 length:246 start_codon:yes stop_codon:yes gene_type:complete
MDYYSPDHDRTRLDHDDPFQSGVLTRCRPVPRSAIRPGVGRWQRLVRWIEADIRRVFWTLAIFSSIVLLAVHRLFGWLTGT